MKQYHVKNITQNNDHLLLTLEPASSYDRLEFWPGQYAAIGFKRNRRKSPMRCFSMVSSPIDGSLQFATRVRGRFTRQLAQLQEGDEVYVQGPYGEFVLDPDDSRVMMLAAGIGITPFMSIIRHATQTGSKLPITLLYANRSASDIAFYDELRELQSQNPNFRVVFVVSDGQSDASKSIYTGRINESLLQKATGGQFAPWTYFLCGPPKFGRDMSSILQSNGVDEESIITESFTQGYGLRWRLGEMSIPSITYALTGLTLLAGIAAVMGIDLIRYVPKVSASQTPSAAATTSADTTTTQSTPATSTSTDTSSTSGATSNTSSSSTTNSSTNSSNTTSNSYYYQPPVSRAS